MEIDRAAPIFKDDTESSDSEISRHLSNGSQVTNTPTTQMQNCISIHHPADLPLPFGVEEGIDVIFIDPLSGEGKRILSEENTTIPEMFALMRQFVSPVGNHIHAIVEEMLRHNVGVNDIDATSGMSMLHYCVRSEAIASDLSELPDLLTLLLKKGADPAQRTLHTDMNALHIAAYFNCSKALEIMLGYLTNEEIEELLNSMSSEFEFGTPLHIASANLNVEVAEILVKFGADLTLEDELSRTAEGCLPSKLLSDEEKTKVQKLTRVLNFKSGFFAIKNSQSDDSAVTGSSGGLAQSKKVPNDDEKNELKIGDHVFVGGVKKGVIRFIGQTKFSPGIWCGVELDERLGKNDGSINGVRYFSCERCRGVFTPLSKVSHAPALPTSPESEDSLKSPASKTSLTSSSPKLKCLSNSNGKLRVGMVVQLDKFKERGKVRFIGETDFASGIWVGLSLSRPVGKNNGTVKGKEYFKCRAKHGIMVRPSRISVDGISGDAMLP